MNTNCVRCGGSLNTLGDCERIGCTVRPSPYDASYGPISKDRPKPIMQQIQEDREARLRREADAIVEAYIRRAINAEEQCAELNNVVSILRQRHREFAKMLADAMPAVREMKEQIAGGRSFTERRLEFDAIEYWLARAGEIVAEFHERTEP